MQAIKVAVLQAFLEICQWPTREIHQPIVDLDAVRGHPNPNGLGRADEFSRHGSPGQASVLFKSMRDYREADARGRSLYGGAEYAVVQSPEAEDVCRKIAATYKATDAVICPSGLAAISTVMDAYKPKIVLVPDDSYSPAVRYLKEDGIPFVRYPVSASKADVMDILDQALCEHHRKDIMLYIEAPGSGTFGIPDIDGLASLAKAKGIRSVMDNTYASHVRFNPLDHGITIAIEATTKYPGGYGDTPGGVVVARDEDPQAPRQLDPVRRRLRITGTGAVSPQMCTRLAGRMDSTEERMDQHYDTALTVMDWFKKQHFVDRILCPALESSPDHDRFKKYFGKGNGLFSIVFKPDIPASTVDQFTDALLLFRVGESWGGHVSLVLPVEGHREVSPLPRGIIRRFHAGLEDAGDLVRDLDGAKQIVFDSAAVKPGTDPRVKGQFHLAAK